MAAEILTGIALFKNMLDMTKALKDLNDAAVRNAAVIELQDKIMAAREQQTTLAERVRELEAEVAGFKTWEAEKQRYELAPIREGALAYRVKEEARGAEPPHWLCAQCFGDRKKSLLQEEHRFPGRCTVMACHQCGSDIYIHGQWDAGHGTFAQRTGRGR